jgi:hypothetical protein
MFSHRLDSDTELRLIEDSDAEALYALIDKNRELSRYGHLRIAGERVAGI